MGAAITVLLSIAGVIAAVWGLLVLGSTDAARDEIIQRLFVSAVSVVGLFILYLYWIVRIPREWDEESRQRIEELEKRLTPICHFVWRPEDNKFLEVSEVPSPRPGGPRRLAKIARVAVKNESYAVTLKGVTVSVVNYTMSGYPAPRSIDMKLVARSIGRPIVDLDPRREETFTVFKIDKGKSNLKLGPFADNTRGGRFGSGKYKVKMTVSALNMARVDQFYLLEFDDYENLEFRPWRPGDASSSARAAGTSSA
jgi:hypothetical protein